jgi:hypothetical protein
MTDDLADPLGWIGALDGLRELAGRLALEVRATDHQPREADIAVKVFGSVMSTYLTHLWAEPDHPAFLPSVGYHQMYGSPNADTVYRDAAIDGAGVYLITGHRGTAPDVTIMPFGRPVAGGLQTFAPFDLDDLTIDDDGTFEVVASATPPAAARDWLRLDTEMRTLMLRSVSDRWSETVDPRLAIVRLDVDTRRRRPDPAALERRFRSYAAVVEAKVMSGVRRVAALRADGVVNAVTAVDYSATGGGLDDQWYQEGCFALADRQVLLVETTLDPRCRAFALSLTDAAFSTIDWSNASGSLNRNQAVVDEDGILRVVVGGDDPGLANWLDTTGHLEGALQFRWVGTTAAPEVTIRSVPLASLDDHVPPLAARVTPAQRATALRHRQIGAQLRTRW